MKIKLTEGQMNTHLIIALGILAAIMVMGIGSHVAFASKFSKTSFQRASVTCGALALVTTLFARQQIEKKKLRPELAMGLK
ncbi:MAG: hypothetical protein ACJ71M_15995 [Nitrososphaeraceae archaeon]